MDDAELGDIAIVTTQSGYKYVGYLFDTHIDWIWLAFDSADRASRNQLRDPDVSWEVIGRVNDPKKIYKF